MKKNKIIIIFILIIIAIGVSIIGTKKSPPDEVWEKYYERSIDQMLGNPDGGTIYD